MIANLNSAVDIANASPTFPKQLGWEKLFQRIEELALEIAPTLPNRAEHGQFFTPVPTAQFMASLFEKHPTELRVIDAGAGLGTLSIALLAQASEWQRHPRQIHLTAFELEARLVPFLESAYESAAKLLRQSPISFQYQIIQDDFLEIALDLARGRTLLRPSFGLFNAAILNPPYGKLSRRSNLVQRLKRAEVDTTNQYAAFLWLATKLLQNDGELVAIIPRSFANGLYFRPFRKFLLKHMSLQRIHLFDDRKDVFKRDRVLQETIILAAAKKPQGTHIIISTTEGAGDDLITQRTVPATQVIKPQDAESFLRIVPDEMNYALGNTIGVLEGKLEDLGIQVSTGKVVEFRATPLLQYSLNSSSFPLLHPHNLMHGFVVFPNGGSRKPIAIDKSATQQNLLIPCDTYVLVKRLTAKEEIRRVVAAVLDPHQLQGEWYGIENHLNYFHMNGRGLDPTLARGLTAYLNSTMVDEFFRQFSGHTQINATDLRNLVYPSREQLFTIGENIRGSFPPQEELDELVLGVLKMGNNLSLQAKRKIEQARQILAAIGAPKEQQNQRSALTLLGLTNVRPSTSWQAASAPLVGIHGLMGFFAKNFGVTYAENTRETVRRYTMHQFLQLGLVVKNPDDLDRPINSPDTRYQIEPTFLNLIQSFGTEDWDRNLATYLRTAKELNRLKARERNLQLYPVSLPDGLEVHLTAGKIN